MVQQTFPPNLPLSTVPLDGTTKGIPLSASLTLADIPAQSWNVLAGDVPLPIAVIRDSALRHNSAWMRAFCARHGALLAPHVKTTMCPAIIRRQFEDGAWGVTVANAQQALVCRRFGAERILVANQVIGALELDWLAGELQRSPELEIFLVADSEAVVERAAAAVRRASPRAGGGQAGRGDAEAGLRPFGMLTELGYRGGRTGARSVASALGVARAVAAAGPALRLAGVETFEGLITPAGGGVEAVEAVLDGLAELFAACRAEGLFADEAPIVSAGGSAYFDVVAERLAGLGATLVLRSGCYITHDCGMYGAHQHRIAAAAGGGEGLRNAIEVWAYVQSLPEPGLALLTAGRRDCGTDAGMPVPLWHSRDGAAPVPLTGCTVTGLNDQHAHMRVPEGLELRVGDRVGLGILHPCTTFDKWDVVFLVDDSYTVLEAMKTYF